MFSTRVGYLATAVLASLFPLSAVCQRALGAPATSQVPAGDPTQPVPTIQVTSRLVVLDIVVSDGKGTPVKGLKPADFTLTEDGVPQRITGFTERDAADVPAPPPEASLPPNTFAVAPPIPNNSAMTAIVIAANGGPFFSVQSELRSYLKKTPPQTPIGIFRLDCEGMHLVQGFTADREVLQEAANSKRMLPPLDCILGRPVVTVSGGPTHQLARYLMGFTGRINVLWFSNGGGGPQNLDSEFPDVESFVHELDQPANVTRLNPIAFYFADANGVGAPAIQWFSFDESVDEIAYQLGYPSALGTAVDESQGSPAPMIQLMNIAANKELFNNNSPLSAPAGPSFAGCAYREIAEALGGAGFCNTNGFKEIMAGVVSTGSHYYTLSYRSTNANWNGAYRHIHVTVRGLNEIKPPEPTAWQQVTGFEPVSQPKLEYRRGYYANSTPSAAEYASFGGQITVLDPTHSPEPLTSSGVPQRKLISDPQKTPPGPYADDLARAMALGSPAPDALHFAVVVNAPTAKDKIGRDDVLPKYNYLNTPFRAKPFRNFHVHYWVSPEDLHFARTPRGTYRDDLRFVAVVYRDDGLVANSLETSSHVEVTADQLENVQVSGVTLDQMIAIPVDGSYFLRTGVQETATGRTGAVEVPTEWIHLSPGKAVAQNQPPR